MISRQDIEEFAAKIAEQFQPEKIILFGSYAYGTPTPDSDVDLMVIMDHDTRNVEKAIEIDCSLDRRFPVDLFVRKPEDIRRRVEMHDSFIRTIINRGKTIYAREHA